MGGSGISWIICKSFAPRCRLKTTAVPRHSVFYRPDALPAAQPTTSEHQYFCHHPIPHQVLSYVQTENSLIKQKLREIRLIMVALWNRADHYIFALWFLYSAKKLHLWKYFVVRFNNVHAFGYNFAGSERIWMKFGNSEYIVWSWP